MIERVRGRGRGWRVVAGAALALGGLLAAVGARAMRDAWPVAASIAPPVGSWAGGFSPDGRSFRTVAPCWVDSWWDAATGAPAPAPAAPGLDRQNRVPGGRGFVGIRFDHGLDGIEVAWVDASGATRARFPARMMNLSSPTLEDDGRSIRAVLRDADRRTAVVTWDVATGAESRRPLAGPAGRPGVRQVPQACSPDGRTLAYFDLDRHGVLLWDADADRQRGPALRAPTSRLAAHAGAAFTPDGRSLVVSQADGRAEVWDLSGPRLSRAIRVHPEGYYSNDVQFTPDGRLMASTGQDPHAASPLAWAWTQAFRLAPGWFRRVSTEVAVVDLATGARLARAGGSIHARFSPDGRSVATTEPDGTIAIRAVPRPPAP